MKQITTAFKNEIKTIGKQQEIQIIFGELLIDSENINSINYSYDGSLLKSVMKQLNIDSNINIPINAEIGLKYGLLVNGTYEYLDFGKFIVTEVEKKEDTNSYSITCYDKLLYSMKKYENMGIVYPITIKDYLQRMCNYLGLNFASYNDIFVNNNKIIPSELYLDSEGKDLGYTFRDVFDELAQVTGSVICINKNDEVEVRYINDSSDTINEEYFKDINVNFGEKYGPINSIVLSRAGESDNIYLRDENSIEINGLTEIKIIDNQIMNFNNRDEFLPELLDKLNGIEYYLNDFSSTGICYYDILDRYNVEIGENTYSCVMLNDEINITQGLEENIYTKAPETTQTDYTKADKTDRKINQTYLIVDKQNQKIESVISKTDEQNQKIAKVTQTVDELNSKISDIADITISSEDNDAMVEFTNINESEPIRIVVRPIIENISYLYPANNLYPSDTLFPKSRIIRFENTKTEEIFDYILPNDLLYYDSENYDEFILDYEGQSCVVNKRIGYNADGTTYVLDKEITLEYEYPRILLTDGDYKVSVLGYNTAYIFVRLMSQNLYTTQFATKAELSSEISQTAKNINLSVDAKLSNYSTTTEMNSAINVSANSITSSVSQTYATKNEVNTVKSEIKQTTDSIQTQVNNNDTDISNLIQTANSIQSQVSSNDNDISRLNQTANNISTEVSKKVGNNEIISKINQSAEAVQINANKISLSGKQINLTSDNINIKSNNFNVDKNGTVNITSGNMSGLTIASDRIYMDDIGMASYKGAYAFWAGETNNKHGGSDTNALFKVGHDGRLQATEAIISGQITATSGTFNGNIRIKSGNDLIVYNANGYVATALDRFGMRYYNNTGNQIGVIQTSYNTVNNQGYYGISVKTVNGGGLVAFNDGVIVEGNLRVRGEVIQGSFEEIKKNIELYNKPALEQVINSDIYTYNLKTEKDTDKKHIGLVIGDNYKTPNEIITDDGISPYSMVSLLWKAVQEQQQQIEELKNEIKQIRKEIQNEKN